MVYRYDRVNLNLCLCKNLLCRVVEEPSLRHRSALLQEHEDAATAKAMMAVLCSVSLGSSGEAEETFVDLESILAKYLGEELFFSLRSMPGLFGQESRMREHLRSKLDMLCHKVSMTCIIKADLLLI